MENCTILNFGCVELLGIVCRYTVKLDDVRGRMILQTK